MIRILFQGDSVTDGGRDRTDPTHLGVRYVKYAAQYLREMNPQLSLEILNRGIAGNETADLIVRMEQDIVQLQPDVISLMIGINDTEHYAKDEKWLDAKVFEKRYRLILQTIREKTNAKLMVMEPFYMPPVENSKFRQDLAVKVDIIRRLASEFADVYVPTEGLLHSTLIGQNKAHYIPDGLHPTEEGSEYLARICVQYLNPLIQG